MIKHAGLEMTEDDFKFYMSLDKWGRKIVIRTELGLPKKLSPWGRDYYKETRLKRKAEREKQKSENSADNSESIVARES
jgi:hypothetical protein